MRCATRVRRVRSIRWGSEMGNVQAYITALGPLVGLLVGWLLNEHSQRKRQAEESARRIVLENLGKRHAALERIYAATLKVERYFALYMLESAGDFDEQEEPSTFGPLETLTEFRHTLDDVEIWLDQPVLECIGRLTEVAGFGCSVALNVCGLWPEIADQRDAVPLPDPVDEERLSMVLSAEQGISDVSHRAVDAAKEVRLAIRRSLGLQALDELTRRALKTPALTKERSASALREPTNVGQLDGHRTG